MQRRWKRCPKVSSPQANNISQSHSDSTISYFKMQTTIKILKTNLIRKHQDFFQFACVLSIGYLSPRDDSPGRISRPDPLSGCCLRAGHLPEHPGCFESPDLEYTPYPANHLPSIGEEGELARGAFPE